MTTKEAFEKEKLAIEAISREEAKEPTMPIGQYMYEADKLYTHSLKDKDSLVAVGLDVSIIDAIPQRNQALRYAQSIWAEDHDVRSQTDIEWSTLRKQGEELRAILLHTFKFAYRNDENMKTRLKRIEEGSGNADNIQDLHDLAILGKENVAPLVVVDLDVNLLDTAADLAVNMSKKLAEANVNREQLNELKLTRDKAFTHLKRAVDEVRDHGKFAFWRNDNKLKGYKSEYYARKHQKAKASEK